MTIPGQGPAVHVDGRALRIQSGESVLETLERAEVDVPSGCRSGTCCKCMLQVEAGQAAPAGSQRGLRPTLVSEGYFLSCQAKPTGDLRIRSGEGPTPTLAAVVGFDLVADDVLRLVVKPAQPFAFKPGQYLDVLHASGAKRSYSIASLPRTGELELHIRRVPGGLVSGWLHSLAIGDQVQVRGAFGQCFHIADDPDRKLLLIGAGTGLAPLLGIARDALDQGHTGPIDLVHGGLDPSRLYLRDELRALAAGAANLTVHHCVLRNGTVAEHEGRLDQVALEAAGSLTNARAFLCGDSAIVQALQRALFMAGMASSEILADPFTPAVAQGS